MRSTSFPCPRCPNHADWLPEPCMHPSSDARFRIDIMFRVRESVRRHGNCQPSLIEQLTFGV